MLTQKQTLQEIYQKFIWQFKALENRQFNFFKKLLDKQKNEDLARVREDLSK